MLRSKKNKIILLLLIIIGTIGIGSQKVIAQTNTDDFKNAITSIKITDQDGSPLNGSVSQWDKFRIVGSFKLPNNVFHEGDKTIIKLPDKIKFATTVSFDVKSITGEVVAKAKLNELTKEVVLTYTDYVEKNSDVEGTFYFYTKVDTDIVKENTKILVTIDIDGNTIFVDEIDYEKTTPSESEFDKSGWFKDDSNTELTYELDVNKSKKKYKDVVITDLVSSYGASIIPGTIKIEKGNWIINNENTGWHLDGLVDVTDQYQIKLNTDNKGFTIKLGDINPEDGFSIRYDIKLNYAAIDGEVIKNKATMKSIETQVIEKEVKTTYIEGGGTGKGNVYNITLLKVNEEREPLASAEFKLIRDRNQENIGTFTSNEQGIIKFDDILKDDYTIIEVKSPEGYKLLSEPLKVKSNDFGEDLKLTKEVINTKIEKPEVLPVYSQFEVEKKLTGEKLVANQFKFLLKDKDNNVLQTKTNDKTGKIKFDKIKYTKEGNYEYYISEKNEKKNNVKYDKHVIKVNVNVTKKENKLIAKTSYTGNKVFVNEIKTNPKLPKTGVENTQYLYIISLIVTGIALVKIRKEI